jgi:hypothetical protein
LRQRFGISRSGQPLTIKTAVIGETQSRKIFLSAKIIACAEFFRKFPNRTCSPPLFIRVFTVNNLRTRIVNSLDFTGESELFTRCSPRDFGG